MREKEFRNMPNLIKEFVARYRFADRHKESWEDILYCLFMYNSENIYQVDIAEKCDVSKSTVSNIIGDMKVAGIVSTERKGKVNLVKPEQALKDLFSMLNKQLFPGDNIHSVVEADSDINKSSSSKVIVIEDGLKESCNKKSVLEIKIEKIKEDILKAMARGGNMELNEQISELGGSPKSGGITMPGQKDVSNSSYQSEIVVPLFLETLSKLYKLEKMFVENSGVITALKQEKSDLELCVNEQKSALLAIRDQVNEISEEAANLEAEKSALQEKFILLQQKVSDFELELVKKDQIVAAVMKEKDDTFLANKGNAENLLIKEGEIKKLTEKNQELQEMNNRSGTELLALQEKERSLISEIAALKDKLISLEAGAETVKNISAEESNKLQAEKDSIITELKDQINDFKNQIQELEERNIRSSSEFMKLQEEKNVFSMEKEGLKNQVAESEKNRKTISDAYLAIVTEAQTFKKENEALIRELDALREGTGSLIKDEKVHVEVLPQEEIAENDIVVLNTAADSDIQEKDDLVEDPGQQAGSIQTQQKEILELIVKGEAVTIKGRMKEVYSLLKKHKGSLSKLEISQYTDIIPGNLSALLKQMEKMGITEIDRANRRGHIVSIAKEVQEIIKVDVGSVKENNFEQKSILVEEEDYPDAITAYDDISKAELTEPLSHISSIKSDELIKEAEKTIKEKESNPAAIAWKYLLEKMGAIINNPMHRLSGSGIVYPLNDDAIIPIVEKLLEILKPKDSPGFDDNKPLAIEDVQEIDNRLNKLNSKQNIDPSDRIIRAVYCCHDERGMPYDQVRIESGLQNFNGNYDEIMNKLVENGWISVLESGNGKAVSITPGNIRRILGVSRPYNMAEKILHFRIEKKNDSSRVKKSDLINFVMDIIKYIEKTKGVARAATGSDLEEQFKRKISEEQITQAYDAYIKDGGRQKITIEQNTGDYLISLT